MKKYIIGFAVIALTLSVSTPVLAHNDKNAGKEDKFVQRSEQGDDNGLKLGLAIRDFKNIRNLDISANQFGISGKVASTTTATIVINVNGSVHVPNVTNGLATVNVDSNTKYTSQKNDSVTLADVKAGQNIWVLGTVSGNVLTATRVYVLDKISDQFSLTGTVGSTTSGSIVVNITSSRNVPAMTNNIVTVNVNGDTKYKADKHETVTLADIKAGQKVMITGSVNGSTLTAKSVQVKLPQGKVYGEVTAKTATSVTVKNSVTGVTQTINTDADTKVNINGEVKTVADVQVGDKGFVKFKTKLSGMFAKVVNLFR